MSMPGEETFLPPPPPARRRWLKLSLLLGLVVLAALFWLFTPLGEMGDIDALLDAAHRWAGGWWAPLAIVAGFTLAGLVAFPLTALLALTGMLYGPLWGFVVGMCSGLVAASVGFAVGHFLGHDWLNRQGGWIARMSRALGRHGILTVAILRMTPVASFAVINYVSGAAHISYGAFIAGTLIGGTPYAIALTFFGDSLEMLLREPTWDKVLVALAAFLAVLAVALLAHRLAFAFRRWSERRRARVAGSA